MPLRHSRIRLLALLAFFGFSLGQIASHAKPECRKRLGEYSEFSSEAFRAQLRSSDRSQDALTRLQEYFGPILRKLFEAKGLLTQEDTEDLVGEVFLSIVRNRTTLASHPEPAAYIFAIANSRLADLRRLQGRQGWSYSRTDEADWEPSFTRGTSTQDLMLVRKALCLGLFREAFSTGLKPSERRAFATGVLHHDLPFPDQASLYGAEVVSYRSVFSAAKTRLTRLLADAPECRAVLGRDFELFKAELADLSKDLGAQGRSTP